MSFQTHPYRIDLFDQRDESASNMRTFTFVLLPKSNIMVTSNTVQQEQMRSAIAMSETEHPIQIMEVDGKQIVDGYAIARSSTRTTSEKPLTQLHNSDISRTISEDECTCVLFRDLLFNGRVYSPKDDEYVLFPDMKCSPNIPDGSVELRLSDKRRIIAKFSEKSSPFLDASGTFHYKVRIIATEIQQKWTSTNTNAVLFVSGVECKAILDPKAHLIYSVSGEKTFRKIYKM